MTFPGLTLAQGLGVEREVEQQDVCPGIEAVESGKEAFASGDLPGEVQARGSFVRECSRNGPAIDALLEKEARTCVAQDLGVSVAARDVLDPEIAADDALGFE